jgi:hypothetical protein
MRIGKSSIAVFVSLLGCSLCLQTGARADDLLQPEMPSVDTTLASSSMSATSVPTLYGGVNKSGQLSTAIPDNNESHDLSATQNDGKLQTETAAQDAFKLAVQKLNSGAHMTSDDYRALNIGVNGVDCEKFPNEKYAKVISVYRDGPGARAGIRVGDKMVWHAANDFPQGEHIAYAFKKVGDLAPVTIVRHDEPIVVNLVCENMEDIKDSHIRKEWEKVARSLGYPKEGVYSGNNDEDLAKVHD